jgi:GNAT superfamily N-acetyltransferase
MICVEQPCGEEAVGLIRQLDEDLYRRYPEMPRQLVHGLRPSDIANPNFTFLVARIDDRTVGCGALRDLEPGVGEVKRMFVVPGFRGHGIARRILAALESRARELGHTTLRLETGREQPEAICLYKSSGYREIAAFGEYADNTFSVCFEKQLL